MQRMIRISKRFSGTHLVKGGIYVYKDFSKLYIDLRKVERVQEQQAKGSRAST